MSRRTTRSPFLLSLFLGATALASPVHDAFAATKAKGGGGAKATVVIPAPKRLLVRGGQGGGTLGAPAPRPLPSAPPAKMRPERFGPLGRASLLKEVAAGQRALLAHDPLVKSANDANSRFMVVRDKFPGVEHLLGIFTPESGQPEHIFEVTPAEAGDLGRMIRVLLFADAKSDRAPKGGFDRWEAYVNTVPLQPHLHIHGEPQSSRGSFDWPALVEKGGYQPAGEGVGYRVYEWKGRGSAPDGAKVVAVAEPRFGGTAQLAKASDNTTEVEGVIGRMWLDVARIAGRNVSKIEQSRGDGRIVVRGASRGLW